MRVGAMADAEQEQKPSDEEWQEVIKAIPKTLVSFDTERDMGCVSMKWDKQKVMSFNKIKAEYIWGKREHTAGIDVKMLKPDAGEVRMDACVRQYHKQIEYRIMYHKDTWHVASDAAITLFQRGGQFEVEDPDDLYMSEKLIEHVLKHVESTKDK